MEEKRSSTILGKEYRGVKMNSETTMIMESIQGMEQRIMKHLDVIQISNEKTKDQTALNENILTDHKVRVTHNENDIAELKRKNENQHDTFYANFKDVEARLNKQAGKSSLIPVMISIVSALTAISAFLYMILK